MYKQSICSIETNGLCKTKYWRWGWSLLFGRERYCYGYYEQGVIDQDGSAKFYVTVLR